VALVTTVLTHATSEAACSAGPERPGAAGLLGAHALKEAAVGTDRLVDVYMRLTSQEAMWRLMSAALE
jgi:hypothetical protein